MGGPLGARRGGVGVVATLVLVTGCTSVTSGRPGPVHSTPLSSSPVTSTPTSTGSPTNACPSTYAAPDPNRPRVALAFVVAADLAHVSGVEHVVFTPDLPIRELVFRLTANSPATADAGNSIVVTSAHADHGGGAPRYTRSGATAPTQGGLLHIPFAQQVAAGTTVTADIAFRVTLGAQSFDRFGRTGDGAQRFAWFASAQPLLAWERGYGWHAEDLIPFIAESATSEAMDTSVQVIAPAAEQVIMSGDGTAGPASGSSGASGGVRTWRSHIGAARDVSVAVGPFAVSDTRVGPTTLHLGAFTAAERDRLVPEFVRAITELSKRFGPFPFPSLSIARLPVTGGGIEYPSSILMLDGSRLVAVHETAHQWFYAMVGDSQALHPWLDEAFASFSEHLVNGEREPAAVLKLPGAVDRSTESYGTDVGDYYTITYDKGAAALEAARDAAGPARFDAALRCYVNANAWRIANPRDLATALQALPAAVAVLRRAGALP